MTLAGFIMATDYLSMVEIRDQLTAALAVGAGVMPGRHLLGRVGAVGGDRLVHPRPGSTGNAVVDFTIDMVAPDPRRYGPWQRVGPIGLPTLTGGLRLPHRFPWNFGSVAPAAVSSYLTRGRSTCTHGCRSGGFDAVTVRDLTVGRRLTLDWPIAASDTVVLDTGARRADLGEAELTRWMTARQWFVIPPGATHEFRFDVEARRGTPTLAADYRIGAH